MHSSTLLVTGASGHLGRRVVELLLAAGAGKVVAASRTPGLLADLAAAGADLRKADFNSPSELVAAFAGADRALIVSTNALDVPGLRRRQHKAAVEAAVQAGVKHILYVSIARPEPGSLLPFAPDHFETEQAIKQSGAGWTILRNARYADNLLQVLPRVIAARKWYSAAGDGRMAVVSREDAARAAAAALMTDDEQKHTHDVTGPEALTVAAMAAIVSDVCGRPIDVIRVSGPQLAAGLAWAGIPISAIPSIVGLDANTRAGRADLVTDTVERLTGQPAQSLRAFLTAHRMVICPS